jgi:hypothetical protein
MRAASSLWIDRYRCDQTGNLFANRHKGRDLNPAICRSVSADQAGIPFFLGAVTAP